MEIIEEHRQVIVQSLNGGEVELERSRRNHDHGRQGLFAEPQLDDEGKLSSFEGFLKPSTVDEQMAPEEDDVLKDDFFISIEDLERSTSSSGSEHGGSSDALPHLRDADFDLHRLFRGDS